MLSSRHATILFILSAIIILGLFSLSVRSRTPPSYKDITSQPAEQTNSEIASPAKPTITTADPSIGPINASLTIVEFSDFRCPHCAAADFELKKIQQAYPARIRIVWKDFPILPPLNLTWLAHSAARCAEKQQKFWEFHDLLFANQSNLDNEKLLFLARELNLDESAFQQCLRSGLTEPLISRGFEEGKTIGVDGTPFFFVNGEKWTGEMTVEKIGELIRE